MTAMLWSKPVGKAASTSYAKIELPMLYVPPINIQPHEADIKEMTAGSLKSIGFFCFSPTRMDFNLSARPENDDPCFEVKCEPRSNEQLAKDLQEIPEKFPIMKGYLIAVQVH